jgi:hypothetical protein
MVRQPARWYDSLIFSSHSFVGNKSYQDLILRDVKAMILRDRNHPSVVIWGVRQNECPNDVQMWTKTQRLAKSMLTSLPSFYLDFYFNLFIFFIFIYFFHPLFALISDYLTIVLHFSELVLFRELKHRLRRSSYDGCYLLSVWQGDPARRVLLQRLRSTQRQCYWHAMAVPPTAFDQ